MGFRPKSFFTTSKPILYGTVQTGGMQGVGGMSAGMPKNVGKACKSLLTSVDTLFSCWIEVNPIPSN
jgi:hypothetical protein